MKPSDYFSSRPSKANTQLEFQKWFNDCDSINESISSGFTDFVHKIFTNDFYPLIGDPSKCTALEIGFGGGRLMLPAAFFFKKVVGIDIHNDFHRTRIFLESQGRKNYELFNGYHHLTNQIPEQSIDFVYSFIVFQHFDCWAVAEGYLIELSRVMKKGSCGIIYFGRNDKNAGNIHIENPTTYEDFPMILHVSEEFAKERITKNGFTVIESGITTKRPWQTSPSRQFYVKFKL